MRITITIDCDNPAFEDCEGAEAARILKDVISDIEDETELNSDSWFLRDNTGKTVGKVVIW